jgi:hypothetical protein
MDEAEAGAGASRSILFAYVRTRVKPATGSGAKSARPPIYTARRFGGGYVI